jgi:hypothetical protein
MVRPILTELALFLLPFIAYAVYLAVTRSDVLAPASWSISRLAWLTIAALVLVIGSFVGIAQFSGSPPGSTYIPAHMENGRFVPGETR